VFAFLAFACSSWEPLQGRQWVVSMGVSISFLAELVRVDRVYASVGRGRGARREHSRFKRGLLTV
jgi:hypothetical protein